MIKIIKELDIEVTKPNIFQALVAKQYDMNTRFLKVTLKDEGERITIPQTETAKVVINAERKDGMSRGFDGEINEDGTVTVPLHSWMLELDGTVICDISVIDTAANDNKKLTTTSFTLLVEKAAYGGDDITSDPQYDVLVALLEAAPTAQASLDVSNQALEISKEANSKYDACVEATNNANAVRREIEAGGYIESLKELNEGSKFSFWVGSQEEYDALETTVSNCLYLITNDPTYTLIQQDINDLDDKITEIDTRVESKQSQNDTAIKTINNNISTLQNNWGRFNRVFFDVADNDGTMLNFKDDKTRTCPGIENYSLFLIDGIICARYGDTIKGTASNRYFSSAISEYTTEIVTLQLTINQSTLSAVNWSVIPVKVYTQINTTKGNISSYYENTVSTIIGIC